MRCLILLNSIKSSLIVKGKGFVISTKRLTCRFEPTWKDGIPVKLWYEGSIQSHKNGS